MKSLRKAPCLVCAILAFTFLCGRVAGAEKSSALLRDFQHPPAAARPWVYWFWLNGNISSNGITADLEAMQRVGIGGVLIMEVDQGTPKGPAAFGGPLWRELFKHVCAEAHRLGLEVNMNNDAGWCGSGGPWITPELAMQKLVWTETNIAGPRRFDGALAEPKATGNYYRDITVYAFPTPEGDARIDSIQDKAAFTPKHVPPRANWPAVAAAQTISRDRIIKLTTPLGADGKFSWDVPPGNWTILRLGHTLTGKDNHPAPEAGRGLESDKFSRAATEKMFDGLMGKLISDSKPLAGKTLVTTHIDSWETGSQNWTPKFRAEFQKRRGYDPMPLLPVVTGRVVGSPEVSERFLWDLRQTVSDLIIENYAGHFRTLAHRKGLNLSIEAYDAVPCDEMTYAGQADEPMAEFWSWSVNTAYSCTEMASAAHVYGRRILGAEAFTATDGEKWLHHPASIKALGDWAFCEGINRFVFHRYALQPWRDAAPGISMGPWGLHYERTQTWWEQSTAWHEYLARCQFMLRQGLFVADVCFLQPEGSPMRFTPTLPGRTGSTPDRPGYNFDGCTPEVLLTRMKVKDGRLVLPDGMSYRVLVLPQLETMTPTLLRKVRELAKAGATIIGPPPQKSPSLAGYPQSDAEVKKLASELWEGSGDQRVGKGRVIWSDKFKTPFEQSDDISPLAYAKWIWHNEGNPASSAPVGARYFRRTVTLSRNLKIASARIAITADNSFELWVNGRRAGAGDSFNQLFNFDIAPLLKSGTNILTVAAVNGADHPNPAGLIAALTIKFQEGNPRELVTDAKWESATTVSGNWTGGEQTTSTWNKALVLGPVGMPPWGVPGRAPATQYVFPDFATITNVLATLGLPPDFEADEHLRYIHRREGDTDVYFVANPATNWLGATCTFRVAGKVPELWNPLTGETSRQVVFETKDGRTSLPLWFEPAGSMFVVFRAANKTTPETIVDIKRNGESAVPQFSSPLHESPAVELLTVGGDEIRARVWQSGRYELKTASGQKRAFNIALPSPLVVSGSWEVRFQPKQGTAKQVMLTELMDWAKHSDDAVKYFSGEAIYTKAIALPAELLGAGKRVYLDLGRVAVIAQVRLNGKELGALWKPPYRVDITAAVRAGDNTLEVRVVNLWINRMIGDEQLAEDSERNANGTLKAWPQWVQDEKPSPTGRSTFTSWRLWQKDSALQESGLLGPVKLVPTEEVQVGKRSPGR